MEFTSYYEARLGGVDTLPCSMRAGTLRVTVRARYGGVGSRLRRISRGDRAGVGRAQGQGATGNDRWRGH